MMMAARTATNGNRESGFGNRKPAAERKQLLGWMADLAARAGDGAFVVDRAQRIVFWNRAAEAISGLSSAETVGRRCHEVFCGRDEDGNRVCCPRCPMFVMVQAGERVAPRDMVVTARGGEQRWVNFSTLAAPGGAAVLHLFRDISDHYARARMADEVLLGRLRAPQTIPGPLAALTSREREILGLLAKGGDTREIAAALFISPLTARNHVHHILRKLGSSSRAEAVAVALRGGF